MKKRKLIELTMEKLKNDIKGLDFKERMYYFFWGYDIFIINVPMIKLAILAEIIFQIMS